MSTEDPDTGARRHSTLLVIATGLAGLVIGAIAAFAITGLVFTVRVQLPPPPYPPPLQSAPVGGGCLLTTPPSSGVAPTTPGRFPLPPPA